jgi:hypothetical protein
VVHPVPSSTGVFVGSATFIVPPVPLQIVFVQSCVALPSAGGTTVPSFDGTALQVFELHCGSKHVSVMAPHWETIVHSTHWPPPMQNGALALHAIAVVETPSEPQTFFVIESLQPTVAPT